MARFTLPRDLYHGKGALEALKTFTGKKAIVCVGGGSMKRFGFLDRAVGYLKEAGMEVELFEGIEPDPSVETVMRGAEAMLKFEPDWIIAMGGGSPIDAAKAMWIKYEYPDITFEEMCKVFGIPPLRRKAHFCAISSTCGKNFMVDPGFHRTLLGDGLATMVAGMFGGPANTTYGENTGVLALSKIYDPLVIRIAAVLAIILSFSPKFEAVINTIPTGIIGGISFVLYGMISAIGVRNVVENRVDFTNSRNLIVAAVILVCALGFNSVGGVSFAVAGVTINLSGLAVAAIAGILLNAILPGNDYEFDAADGSEAATSSNLQV